MEYETSQIPYVYIISAILSVIIGFIYAKMEEKLSVYSLLRAIIIFIFISILIQFILISTTDFKPAYFGMMVFKDILWMFIGIEFGMITGAVFDIRQGKRLFGLLVSGEIIAGIIGGLSIGAILEYIDTVYLLLISSIVMVFSFLVLLKILNSFTEKFDQFEVTDEDEDSNNITYKSLLSNRYYISFFIVSILAFLVFYFIDFMFYYNVEQQYPSEKELAKFFGIFYATLNIVNLFSSFFISGRALSRYGIAFGLLIIPIMATAGTLSLLGALSLSLSIAFLIMVSLKLLNEVFDISILAPSFRIVYQSIPENQRNKVLALRETIIEPLAMGFAGVILIFLSTLENKEIIYWVIIALSLIWIVFAILLKKGYVVSLKKITEHRRVFTKELDLESIGDQFFLDKLKSDNYIEVIYAMESLMKIDFKDINTILRDSLSHKNRYVRSKGLELIYEIDSYDFFLDIKKFLKKEEDQELKAYAVLVYCKLGEIDAIRYIRGFLENKEYDIIKENTIAGLIKYCGIDGILVAGPYLNNLFESKNEKDNLNALNLLNKIGTQGYRKALRKILKTNKKSVKIEAIKTIGNLRLKKFLHDLIFLLHDPLLKKHALNSLKKFGVSIFPKLKSEFEHSTNIMFKESLITVIASMRNEKANNFLLTRIDKEPKLLEKIIEELYNNHYKSKDQNMIETIIDKNNLSILNLAINQTLLDKNLYNNTSSVIQEAINNKLQTSFLILSFLYARDTITKTLISFKSEGDNKKAYAIELLDNILNNDLRKKLLPIIENSSIEQKALSYKELEYKTFESDKELVEELLLSEKTDTTILISLIYEIGKNKDKEFKDKIIPYCDSNEIFVKETADWAINQIG